MRKSVFGLAKTEDQVRRIVEQFQNEGFNVESISVLAYDKDNRMTRLNEEGDIEANVDFFRNKNLKRSTIGHEKNTKAPEGAAAGATAGGILGGTLGLLAGIGALAIPGVGPFIAAGPLMAALGGSAIGGSLGLIVGGLVGLGIPEFEAKKFEKGLKEGHILVSVDTQDSKRMDRAKEIMKNAGFTDIASVGEKAASRR